MFRPKAIADLEPKVREYCAHALDPLVGAQGFDFIDSLGAFMPMRTIGLLLGIYFRQRAYGWYFEFKLLAFIGRNP